VDRRRVYVALVFFPLFYLLVRHLPAAAFSVFVAAGILLAQYEYYRFHFPEPMSLPIGLGLALGLLVTAGFAAPGLLPIHATVSAIVVAVLLGQLWGGREPKAGLLDTAVVGFGVFYLAWLLGHMITLRQFAEGPFLIFFLFLVTWANDTGAYYVGTFWGRHPLAPRISPRKTWEGAIGGLLGSVLAALACQAWFLDSLSTGEALGAGVLIGLAAPLGDLAESILKRSADVKDSGSILPGHGGLLDRIDSLIFTTPAFYYYLLAVRTP
jgi:phosphatidate cytidylyltransferase